MLENYNILADRFKETLMYLNFVTCNYKKDKAILIHIFLIKIVIQNRFHKASGFFNIMKVYIDI